MAVTRLQSFLLVRGIPPARLERESGFSRKQLLRWRTDGTDIRRRHMVRLLCAARRITGEEIRMEELFVIEPNTDDCGHDSHK